MSSLSKEPDHAHEGQTEHGICPGHLGRDGSSFSKAIVALLAEGYEVVAAQHGLDTFAADVAAVKRTPGRIGSLATLA
jgi:hypothetical protein